MEQALRLRVDGWSNLRFGKVQGNLIMFEVMSLGCACQTCFNRLDVVRNRMKTADVKSWLTAPTEIPERNFERSIVLAVEPREMPTHVDRYLSDLLGLRIS